MLDILRERRSIRRYKDREIETEKIERLMEAALRSPSSRGINPWRFLFVTDRALLEELSRAKENGSSFLKGASLGVVVCAAQGESDVWVEDCSIASIILQLAGQSLGLGSCWIQIRKRMHSSNLASEDYIKRVLLCLRILTRRIAKDGAGSPQPSGCGMKAESFALITFALHSIDINIMPVCKYLLMISYKCPLFPSKATQQKLAEALDACRWLHNKLLEKMNDAREEGVKLKTYDTQNMIPSLKLENPKLNLVYSKVLQMVNYTLWSSIKGLSASKKNGRKIGHVRFKGYGWYKTMNYNQSGFKLDQDHGLLHLSKIGDIKIKMHRKIQGCIKAILIKRECRQWFAIVQADQDPESLPETGKSIGLDVGLKSFVVDTDGNSVENPRFAEKSADKLTKAQRKLSRAEKRSNNRQKIKEQIEKIHAKINHQRDDFLHKLSRFYVNNYDNICVEDLDVKGLKEKGRNTGMHRSIHDASWSKFMFMLSYKAESAGRKLIKVDPWNTTQRCSVCGSIVKKELSERVHECSYCGFSCDRDYNASRNILIAGMEQPVAPIESKPLHRISVMQVLAMKWEAVPFRTR